MALPKKKLLDDEGDDYWDQSNVSAGFSFDDNPEAITAFNHLSKTVKNVDIGEVAEGPSDLIETVDWSGAKVDLRKSSAQFQASSAKSQSQVSSPLPTEKKFVPHVTSTPTLTVKPQGHTRADSGSSFGSAPSSEADSSRPPPKREFTPGEFAKLEDETRKLKLQVQRLKRDRYHAPDVKDTIRRIIKSEPYSFELYKSREDKVKLLDTAIDYCDGNAIIAVVLFLHQTLSFSLFQEQLLTKPVAANHFVSYLKDHYKHDELVSTLFSLGRKEEAAMFEFRQASRKQNSAAKISALKRCSQSSFASDPSLTVETSLLNQFISLLERQLPIDASDDKTMAEAKDPRFTRFPKQTSLVDQPVLTTLYYCCLYHYDLPPTAFASPKYIKQADALTDRQFAWIAVKALARQQRWNEVEALLTAKSMFGGQKMKSPIPYEKLVYILEKNKAPVDVISNYLKFVPEIDARLKLAVKLKCYHAAVDCFVAQKDRLALLEFKNKLTPHTKDAYYAEAALQNANYKWKN